MARFPSDGGAGFLIGGFAQKMFEHQSKNTALSVLVSDDPRSTYGIATEVAVAAANKLLGKTADAISKDFAKVCAVRRDNIVSAALEKNRCFWSRKSKSSRCTRCVWEWLVYR